MAMELKKNTSTERGKLIVFEGIDKSGKSTQVNKLEKHFIQNKIKYKKLCYPNRHSEIGKIIDKYLKKEQTIDKEAIKLLFAAERHQEKSTVMKLLLEGTNIICDRYFYSGAAYSIAQKYDHKQMTCNKTLSWYIKDYMQIEKGLPIPDKIIYLNVDIEHAEKRYKSNKEKYEDKLFLKKVKLIFESLMHNDHLISKEYRWEKIVANDNQPKIYEQIVASLKEIKTDN